MAGVALLVSLAAFGVSVATYRRAGPRVKVTAHSPWGWKIGDPDLQITVRAMNSGLAPVQVVGVRLAFDGLFNYGQFPSLDLTNDDRYDGPDLNLILAGGSQTPWTFDAIAAMQRQFGINYDGAIVPDLFRRPGSLRKAIKRRLPRMLIPLSFLWFGIVAVVDLGNGVQATSAPMHRLTWVLIREILRRNLSKQSSKAVADQDAPVPPADP